MFRCGHGVRNKDEETINLLRPHNALFQTKKNDRWRHRRRPVL